MAEMVLAATDVLSGISKATVWWVSYTYLQRPLLRNTWIAAEFIYSITMATKTWIRGNILAVFGMFVYHCSFSWPHIFLRNVSSQCQRTINYHNYRLREPPHSESGITSRTRVVAGAERCRSTSRRRLVRHVDTQLRRWEATTGHLRPRDAVLLELDVWGTWRLWLAGSRMDSEREPKRRKWSAARSKQYRPTN